MTLGTAATSRIPRPRRSSLSRRSRIVHEVIDRRDVRTVFQPLMDLASGELRGYEALAPGPVESPLMLFAAAKAVGRTVELDWVCRAAAYRDALAARLHTFVRPDVIKLDLHLVQARTTGEVACIVNAVLAEAEITGAIILAEGIETAEHLAVAQTMGATVGQGWLWGRPSEVLPTNRPPRHPVRLLAPVEQQQAVSPYEVVAARRTPRRTAKGCCCSTASRRRATSRRPPGTASACWPGKPPLSRRWGSGCPTGRRRACAALRSTMPTCCAASGTSSWSDHTSLVPLSHGI